MRLIKITHTCGLHNPVGFESRLFLPVLSCDCHFAYEKQFNSSTPGGKKGLALAARNDCTWVLSVWCYLKTYSSSGAMCLDFSRGKSGSSSSVFPCHRGSENKPIFSSKWPGKPKGRSLSIAEYKQAGSLLLAKQWSQNGPWSLWVLSHKHNLCLFMRFHPSSRLHLRALSFHANCYSVFHFCDMSVPDLSLFELAVATHY